MELENETIILTVGMSFRPMPNVEMSVEEPFRLRRIELGIRIRNDNQESLEVTTVLQQLSGLVAYPWNRQTWFGHGHSCQFESFKSCFDSQFDSGLFASSKLVPGFRAPKMPEFRSDSVQLLWILPVTSEETRSMAAGELEIEDLIKNASRR